MNTLKTILFIAMFLALIASAGCDLQLVTGSGNVVTSEYSFTDFDEVEINNAFSGTITQGDTYRIVVSVDDNLESDLRVEQNGNRVTIGFENPVVLREPHLTYEITLPALASVDASGASVARLSGFAGTGNLTANASGASRIEGDITAGDTNLEASGASTIRLNGQGGALRANAAGASTIDLEDFTTASADVEASGASTIVVNTSGELNAEATGASNVTYLGDPQLGNLNESGGSEIRQR